MNYKILKTGIIVNFISIIGFAASMPLQFDFGSYLFSIFIALSFIVLMSGFNLFASGDRKICGFLSVAFSCIYASIILLVYFAQLTTVRNASVSDEASYLLNFKEFGLMFNYDLLGYAMMSLSAFFAGLTIVPCSRAEKVLKTLLVLNIIFFISCLTVPMLNLFNNTSGTDGIIILEFWCAFFCPITLLSLKYFRTKQT